MNLTKKKLKVIMWLYWTHGKNDLSRTETRKRIKEDLESLEKRGR
jgi:hypothetical protein